jgi:hypothetical protein
LGTFVSYEEIEVMWNWILDYLPNLAKIGAPMTIRFDEQSERCNNQFRADKNQAQNTDTDYLITNVEKRQDTNEGDSLKGH